MAAPNGLYDFYVSEIHYNTYDDEHKKETAKFKKVATRLAAGEYDLETKSIDKRIKVKYYDKDRQSHAKGEVKDGKLVRINPGHIWQKEALNTYAGLYVLSTLGQFYFTKDETWAYFLKHGSLMGMTDADKEKIKKRHSSMMAGEDVAAAGCFRTDGTGNLIHIDNNSGHYRPSAESLNRVIRKLVTDGLRIGDNANIGYVSHGGAGQGTYNLKFSEWKAVERARTANLNGGCGRLDGDGDPLEGYRVNEQDAGLNWIARFFVYIKQA